MSTAVAFGGFPCGSTGFCGELGTSSISPVSVWLTFAGQEKGTANISYDFTVNVAKQHHQADVDATGLNITPPAGATYFEFSVQKGTGVPESMLMVQVTQTT